MKPSRSSSTNRKTSGSSGGRGGDRPDKDRVLTEAVFKAADSLGLSTREIMSILKMTPATYARRKLLKNTFRADSADGSLAVLFLRAYRSLFSYWGGDLQSCDEWLHAKHDYFGSAPVIAMTSIEGLVDVANYLDSVRGF